MSSFIRKALGMTKTVENKEFNDFLKVFECYETNNYMKKVARLLVLTDNGSTILFDSFSSKDSQKSLPIFNFDRRQVTLGDIAFGSYLLTNEKTILFSTRIYDLRKSYYLNPNLNMWKKKSNTISYGKFFNRNSAGHNGVAVCLLLNLGCFAADNTSIVKSQISSNATRRSFPNFLNNESKVMDSGCTQDNLVVTCTSFKRLYAMLFEHCLQFSIIVETLHNEILVVLLNSNRSNWNKYNSLENGSLDVINKAFVNFLDSYKNIFLTKMTFPVWSTLNTTLSVANDSFPINFNQTDCLSSWLNMNQNVDTNSSINLNFNPYNSLAEVFVRSCLDPLIVKSRSKESRSFLCRMLTGIFMFHTGWVDSIIADELNTEFPDATGFNSMLFNSQTTAVSLSNQLLTQAGSVASNLEAFAGNIFNCTVISGRSRQYMLILLYFATYFLRFMCLTRSRECVPELGQADLFELEQQKQRTRLGGKTHRKTGSGINNFTNCGEANDSGISSQEDLTNVVYSASTGSSPTHVSGMALCMIRRLTRDQCRIAEAAAQLIVTRETTAAATVSTSNDTAFYQNLGSIPRSGTSDQPPTFLDGHHFSSPPRINRSQYTEVPLLIEKSFDDDEELCSCLSSEVFPGCTLSCQKQNNNPSNTGPESHSSRRYNEVSRSLDKPSFLSSLSCHTTPNTFNVDPLPASFTNHCLIGSTVLDSYHSEHVLQATYESIESFKPRLEHNLIQWLVYGPLVLRGANLSNNSMVNDSQSSRCPTRQIQHPRWSATGLLINSDTKSVEALTLTQPNPSDLVMFKEFPNPSSTRAQRTDIRGQAKTQSNTNADQSVKYLLSPVSAFKNSVTKRIAPIKAAPIINRLIDQTHSVLTSTNCPLLTLNHLESNLQIIHQKSLILRDLIIEGFNVIEQTNTIINAVGCSRDDLPLLLSIASACSVEVANTLHNNHVNWWNL